MMRVRYDEQLSNLHQQLIAMGAQIERAIASAARAIMEQDAAEARRAIAFDQEVDQKEKDIEALCLQLLLRQQPVARDLRAISSALKMVTDMERIGDQAADISELAVYLTGKPALQAVGHLPAMAQETICMVTDSVEAYVREDLQLARAVIEKDDVVDELFLAIKAELVDLIARDPRCGGQALDTLMVAKYFERIGDHATNIAEWVEYALTGRYKGAVL